MGWCQCRIKVGKLTGIAKPAVALRSGDEGQQRQRELHCVWSSLLGRVIAMMRIVGRVLWKGRGGCLAGRKCKSWPSQAATNKQIWRNVGINK